MRSKPSKISNNSTHNSVAILAQDWLFLSIYSAMRVSAVLGVLLATVVDVCQAQDEADLEEDLLEESDDGEEEEEPEEDDDEAGLRMKCLPHVEAVEAEHGYFDDHEATDDQLAAKANAIAAVAGQIVDSPKESLKDVVHAKLKSIRDGKLPYGARDVCTLVEVHHLEL
uniref:Uncharacterized protein n=2 Tax=Oxyrrhis marina TaxID=2969 RepID=A0A7S3XGG0_OXYMA